MLEQLSAYADGELDGADRAAVEAALSSDAALRKVLAAMRRMDKYAAKLPVPTLDDAAAKGLWDGIAARTIAKGKPAEAAPADAKAEDAALMAPNSWREMAEDLSAGPQVPEARWAGVWDRIKARTVESESAPKNLARGGTSILERQPAAADLTPMDLRAVIPGGRKIVPGEFQRRSGWRVTFLGAGAAAMILLSATMAFMRYTPPPGPTNGANVEPLQAPEVLDQHYFITVKNIEGLEKPVYCFFLKEDPSGVEEKKDQKKPADFFKPRGTP